MNALEQVLSRYLKVPPGKESPEAPDDFEQLAQQVPQEEVGEGIAEALSSDKTPPMPQLIKELFGWGSPRQRISILKQLGRSMGPGFADSFGGGRFRDVLSNRSSAATPDQVSGIDPSEVEKVAAEAERQDPSLSKSMGGMLSKHPDLVRKLGSAAMTIALSRMARRMRH